MTKIHYLYWLKMSIVDHFQAHDKMKQSKETKVTFREFPRDVQELIAYKLNVHDRTMLNCVLPKSERFVKSYDRSLGIIRKAVVKRKVTKFTTVLRDFFNKLPNDDATLNEIRNILPDMFSADVLEADRKDYIFTIVKGCSIETYKQLRNDDFYKDVFIDHSKSLKNLLYTIAIWNHTLFEYILVNDTLDVSLLEQDLPYMFYSIETIKIVLKHMSLSKQVTEKMYVRSVENMCLDTAELFYAHLQLME